MSHYIRPRRHGATIFFTVALATRGSQLAGHRGGAAAAGRPRHRRRAAVCNRCMGSTARPSALHLAVARGGLRLRRPVGRDQGAILSGGKGDGGVEPHHGPATGHAHRLRIVRRRWGLTPPLLGDGGTGNGGGIPSYPCSSPSTGSSDASA